MFLLERQKTGNSSCEGTTTSIYRRPRHPHHRDNRRKRVEGGGTSFHLQQLITERVGGRGGAGGERWGHQSLTSHSCPPLLDMMDFQRFI